MVVSLPQYALDFLHELSIHTSKKASTIKRYEYDLNIFFKWLNKKDKPTDLKGFQNLSMKDFEQFKEEQQYSNPTLKHFAMAIKQLQKYTDQTNNTSSVLPLEKLVSSISSTLSIEELMSEHDYVILIDSIRSIKGLTEQELLVHDLLKERNVSILTLLYQYGLTLQDVFSLNMENISFIQHTITFVSSKGKQRLIFLKKEDSLQLYNYYIGIPEPVRPKYYSSDPFFVAVDFYRRTYKWEYETDSPKRLHMRSIQKMFKKEILRAKLRPAIQIQYLRNTSIVQKLIPIQNLEKEKRKNKEKEIKESFGLSDRAFHRYIQFVENNYEEIKEVLFSGYTEIQESLSQVAATLE